MGFQDALYIQNISYASHEAVEFADKSMEMISYYAIFASTELAKERGTYSTYKGSKWDRGLLPIDTHRISWKKNEAAISMSTEAYAMDWTPVRESVKKHGMRNSNTMAIAPTATISNITGITQSIEPMYKHLFVKSNLSGEFTIPNIYLVENLKKLGLWDNEMLDDLKYFDGSIAEIERIPMRSNSSSSPPLKSILSGSSNAPADDKNGSIWDNRSTSISQSRAAKNSIKCTCSCWKKGLKTTYYLRSSRCNADREIDHRYQ